MEEKLSDELKHRAVVIEVAEKKPTDGKELIVRNRKHAKPVRCSANGSQVLHGSARSKSIILKPATLILSGPSGQENKTSTSSEPQPKQCKLQEWVAEASQINGVTPVWRKRFRPLKSRPNHRISPPIESKRVPTAFPPNIAIVKSDSLTKTETQNKEKNDFSVSEFRPKINWALFRIPKKTVAVQK